MDATSRSEPTFWVGALRHTIAKRDYDLARIGGPMAEAIELIAQAKTLDDVVTATGQYLARWTPEDLALIPRRCRPHWIGSAEDIEMYAGQLQTECARRDASGTAISGELELMRDFFAAATGTILQIKRKTGDEDYESTWPHPVERVQWGYSRGLSKR